jgi:hypothetical protein
MRYYLSSHLKHSLSGEQTDISLTEQPSSCIQAADPHVSRKADFASTTSLEVAASRLLVKRPQVKGIQFVLWLFSATSSPPRSHPSCHRALAASLVSAARFLFLELSLASLVAFHDIRGVGNHAASCFGMPLAPLLHFPHHISQVLSWPLGAPAGLVRCAQPRWAWA